MRRRRKSAQLIISFIFLILTGYLVYFFSPNKNFSVIGLKSPIVPLFIFSLFLFMTSFFTFAFKNLRRGIFLSLLIIFYLLLNLFKLNNIGFLGLLVIIFIVLELVFTRRK
ncbi:MAG TPA: hypothetical protein VFD45_02515 [Patescibacteria group bacterium]|nr:hypothetical protein [Patescibacteria group bacterium]